METCKLFLCRRIDFYYANTLASPICDEIRSPRMHYRLQIRVVRYTHSYSSLQLFNKFYIMQFSCIRHNSCIRSRPRAAYKYLYDLSKVNCTKAWGWQANALKNSRAIRYAKAYKVKSYLSQTSKILTRVKRKQKLRKRKVRPSVKVYFFTLINY